MCSQNAYSNTVKANMFLLAGLPSFLCDLKGPLRRSHGMEGLVSYEKSCT